MQLYLYLLITMNKTKWQNVVNITMQTSAQGLNSTGDFTKSLSLPVEVKVSKNNDLHSISSHTVSQ